MNALIEANRAGEAGRGFSVVANEVAELAARSDRALSQITDKMEKQRSGLEQAQAALARMLDHLAQSTADSEGSIKTASKIRTDVEDSATVASAVASVMGGQAVEFDAIVDFLVQVKQDTEAAAKGSATNISLAETAKQNVKAALGDNDPTSIRDHLAGQQNHRDAA